MSGAGMIVNQFKTSGSDLFNSGINRFLSPADQIRAGAPGHVDITLIAPVEDGGGTVTVGSQPGRGMGVESDMATTRITTYPDDYHASFVALTDEGYRQALATAQQMIVDPTNSYAIGKTCIEGAEKIFAAGTGFNPLDMANLLDPNTATGIYANFIRFIGQGLAEGQPVPENVAQFMRDFGEPGTTVANLKDAYAELSGALGPTENNDAIFAMDGSRSLFTSDQVNLPFPWATTELIGWGDFDGNGTNDVLVGQAGRNAVWLTDGYQTVENFMGHLIGASLLPETPGWSVRSIGDMNGDGKSDILFENGSGTLYQANMDGVNVASSFFIVPPTALETPKIWTFAEFDAIGGYQNAGPLALMNNPNPFFGDRIITLGAFLKFGPFAGSEGTQTRIGDLHLSVQDSINSFNGYVPEGTVTVLPLEPYPGNWGDFGIDPFSPEFDPSTTPDGFQADTTTVTVPDSITDFLNGDEVILQQSDVDLGSLLDQFSQPVEGEPMAEEQQAEAPPVEEQQADQQQAEAPSPDETAFAGFLDAVMATMPPPVAPVDQNLVIA